MGETDLTCAKSPCISCPYRKDVPSGVWGAEEYEKLPLYDGTILEQAARGTIASFFCHQNNGKLCAGWVGAHGPRNLLALRLRPVANAVFDYKSPVPLFPSGKAACTHGKAMIKRPSKAAREMIAMILQKRPDIEDTRGT